MGMAVKTPRERGLGWAWFNLATSTGHEAIVRLLVDEGADVEAWDRLGTTLIRAAGIGHEAVVMLPVEA
jgi:hypothetical protein